MILTEEDLKILRLFCKIVEGESPTIWELMKKVYPDGKVREHQRIERRIKKLKQYHLINLNKEIYKINENKIVEKRTWELDTSKVTLKRFKFPGNSMAEAICIKHEGKWQIVEM